MKDKTKEVTLPDLSGYNSEVKKQKKEDNYDKVENFRGEIVEELTKVLEQLYFKIGHTKGWKYAFIKYCHQFYNETIQHRNISSVEDKSKNSTSKIYMLMLMEIERLSDFSLTKELSELRLKI